MGGFLVVVPRSAPIEPRHLPRLLSASAERAPDGVTHRLTADGTLLVQCGFEVAPESVGERLPKADPSGLVWLVKRGHLNNRSELAARLTRLVPELPLRTDADLMLAAYLAWGERSAGELIGEFAVAIWDGRCQKLFSFRDHLGRRACCYHDGPEWFAVASEPSQILPLPGVSAALDEIALVDLASGWNIDRVRTLYAAVQRVPPGTALTFERATKRLRRYWYSPLCRERGNRPPSEYAPAVMQAFEEAVRSAMHTIGPVVCDNSGGLDSAAVLGMAASLRSRDPSIPEVYSHSRVYPGMDCDESPYIEAVLAKWPVPWRSFDATRPEIDPTSRLALSRSIGYPIGPALPAHLEASEWTRQLGARVQIGGAGGDELFWSDGLPLASGLRPIGAGPRYVRWAAHNSTLSAFSALRHEILRPIVPKALMAKYLNAKGFVPRPDPFLTEYGRGIRDRTREIQPTLSDLEAANVASFPVPGTVNAWEIGDAASIRQGFEQRLPLLDVRLLAVVGRIPLLTHAWRGEWRALQKSAFASLYPDTVHRRVDKADFSAAVIGNEPRSPTAPERESPLDHLAQVFAAREHIDAIGLSVGRSGSSTTWAAFAVMELDKWLQESIRLAE